MIRRLLSLLRRPAQPADDHHLFTQCLMIDCPAARRARERHRD